MPHVLDHTAPAFGPALSCAGLARLDAIVGLMSVEKCMERIPGWDCECHKPKGHDGPHKCWRCEEWKDEKAR